jgi:MoaA/NifB/PqqE/SkfB family radical SAM enzyme
MTTLADQPQQTTRTETALRRETCSPQESALLNKLRVVTFFVTTVCNAKCETCFYWENLNDDSSVMSFEEIQRLSKSMPNFPHLLCSGGEPFMRKDFADILSTFVENNNLCSITIPTNALLTDKIVDTCRTVKRRHPHLMLEISHSLDGLAETHDRMRGVKNNFAKVMDTVNALNELRDELDRDFPDVPTNKFLLLTNTCITNTNVDEIPDLIEYLGANVNLDGNIFEVIRGNPMDPNLAPPPMEKIQGIHNLAIKTNSKLFRKRDEENWARKVSYIRSVFDTQQTRLKTGAMPVICQAGQALTVIEPNGDVRLCELLGTVGNLRDYDLDFSALWLDHEARRLTDWVVESKCSCTHCVNLGHSIDANTIPAMKRKNYERLMRLSGFSWVA